MPNWDFLAGFLVGFVASGVFGFVLQKRRLARKKMGAIRRPQTVTLQTKQTPREVTKSSRVAGLHFVLWTVFLVGVLLGFAWLTIQVFLPL